MTAANSILVVRLDRLGDVLMSLPALQRLRAHLPDTPIDFACPPLYHELLAPLLSQWQIRPCELGEASLNQSRYKGALVLFADKQTHRLLRQKRIPLRVGLFSKWWSFLLLNGGKRQHRSRAEKNEAEYNLDLVDDFLERMTIARKASMGPRISIPSTTPTEIAARAYLQQAGVKSLARLAIVHPGMGGSALNLNAEQYLEVIAALEAQNWEVAVSIGPLPRDQEVLKIVAERRPDLAVLQKQPLPLLRELFRLAQLVVAPSTGPLHLAHYVGTRTIGIYSPVKSHSPKRWEPWGGAGQSTVVVPAVDCGAKKECLGEKCPDYFCFRNTAWSRLIAPSALPSVV